MWRLPRDGLQGPVCHITLPGSRFEGQSVCQGSDAPVRHATQGADARILPWHAALLRVGSRVRPWIRA